MAGVIFCIISRSTLSTSLPFKIGIRELNGSLHIVEGKRRECIPYQNLSSSSRTGSSFSIPCQPAGWDEKEAIPIAIGMSKQTQPGVLTALALASNKVNTKPIGKSPQRNTLNRLRRKSVKKTEAVDVKKISLFDDQREEFGNF